MKLLFDSLDALLAELRDRKVTIVRVSPALELETGERTGGVRQLVGRVLVTAALEDDSWAEWRYRVGQAVVEVGRSPKRPPETDLELIERVSWQLPNVATVAVGGVEDAAVLAGLAWDVGADYALFPPLSRDLLPDVVAGLMRAAVARALPAAVAPAGPSP